MRLLFVDDFMLARVLRDADAAVGGWSMQLAILARRLGELGHEVGVLAWKGANAEAGDQSICRLLETYDPRQGIPKLRFLHPRLTSLASATARFRPDAIVQSCSGLITGAMAWIAQRQRIPFVHRIACDTDADGRETLYLSRTARLCYHYGLRRSSLIICQNEYQREHVAKMLPRMRTAILHNAIAPSSVATSPRIARHYIAWLGVFRRQKNLPLLLRIARKNPEIEFRVAGEAYETLDADSAVAMEGLRTLANVRMAGYVRHSAVPEFLGGAMALLATSDYEGFSNTFLEALAAGTPVIARAAIDPDGMIAKNGLGFIAAEESALSEAVRRAVSLDGASFEAISARCVQHVTAHHSPAAAARRLSQILEPLSHKPFSRS